MREERREVRHETLEELRPLADEVRRRAADYLTGLIEITTSPQADAPASDGLCRATRRARLRLVELARREASEWPHQARALQAAAFGVDETERRLLALGRALPNRPDPDEGSRS